MVFKPAVTLTEMTQLQSVRAGDLIATGTPAGVAMQLPPPWLVKLMQLVPENKKWSMFIRKQKKSGRYLETGDLVECSIAADDGSVSLGKLSNRVQTIDAETR
jgi:2-keto-4-pentenoate hydratase/2-oxohepta-3-ene-1,7-dioic acid hydratase in catechol pathway